MSRARVLLADDHRAVLEMAVALLEPEFEVVGAVGNGRDLLAEAKRLEPDVVVLDISMPLLDGIEAAAQLHASGSKAKVVFLTVHDRMEFVRACFAAGALGYVIKSCMTTDLLPSIHEALAGRHFTSSLITGQVGQIRKEPPR